MHAAKVEGPAPLGRWPSPNAFPPKTLESVYDQTFATGSTEELHRPAMVVIRISEIRYTKAVDAIEAAWQKALAARDVPPEMAARLRKAMGWPAPGPQPAARAAK